DDSRRVRGAVSDSLRLPVLVDEDVWDEFAVAIDALGGGWTAPSARRYVLERNGRRLQVDLVIDALVRQPCGDDIDADLFVLACEVVDAVGGEWSSDGLRRVAQFWGWSPPSVPS